MTEAAKQKLLKYFPRVLFILVFVGISVLFYYSSPEDLISRIGVENTYIIMFVLGAVGGLTTFTGVPYHLILITFASGGSNPLLLGTVTALGVMLGDSTSYFIGYEGHDIIPQRLQNFLGKVYDFGIRYPRALPVLIFLYGAFSPFSNDFIVISSGLAKYPFKKVMIPLALGNLVFNIGVAYLGIYAYNWIQGILT